MGRKPKYFTEAEKLKAKAAANRRSRARKKGKAPWQRGVLDGLAAKAGIDETSATSSEPQEAAMPERSGEPFAGLGAPSLATSDASATDAPSSPDTTSTEEASSTPTTSPGGSTSSPSSDASTDPTKGRIFDTETIQKMAFDAGRGAMIGLGKFAAERGYFAFGEPFDKVVGMASAVVVKKWAERANIDDEEGAAYVVAGFLGINGVQAGRAWYAEKKQRELEERTKQHAAAAAARADQQKRGVSPDDAARQRAEQRPVERAAAGSFGVV